MIGEVLGAELSQFGIRTLIVEPAAFRTAVLAYLHLDRPRPIADYDSLADAIRKRLEDYSRAPPGDPAKAMRLLVDVVRGEGKARGKTWPLYLPMGSAAEEAIREKTGKLIDVLDEWGEIIRDLDLDE